VHEAFGYECVDAGEVDGKLGSNPSAYFMRTIRRRGVWPYWEAEQVGPDLSRPSPAAHTGDGQSGEYIETCILSPWKPRP
jgi:hypothetical protein